MYWIKKKKKYDPTPYSRPLRILHSITGCPIGQCDVRFATHFESVKFREVQVFCPCGKLTTFHVETQFGNKKNHG